MGEVHTLHDYKDERRRPAEHDCPVGRFEAGEMPPVSFKNELAVTQCI
jgi:hypothetical protein